MPYRRPAGPVVQGRRNCTRCSRWRYVAFEFPIKRRKNKSGTHTDYPTGVCTHCKNKAQRIRYEDPVFRARKLAYEHDYRRSPRGRQVIQDRVSSAQYLRRTANWKRAKYWRDPDAARRAQREYHRERWARDPEYRRKVRQWSRDSNRRMRERRAAIRYAQRRGFNVDRSTAAKIGKWFAGLERAWDVKARLTAEHLELLELVAPIPVQAIHPFLNRMLRREATYLDIPVINANDLNNPPVSAGGEILGVDRVSAISKVSDRWIRRVYRDPLTYSVTLETVDKLCLHEDWTLDDVLDVARAWAAENDNPWPCGYRGTTKLAKHLITYGRLPE